MRRDLAHDIQRGGQIGRVDAFGDAVRHGEIFEKAQKVGQRLGVLRIDRDRIGKPPGRVPVWPRITAHATQHRIRHAQRIAVVGIRWRQFCRAQKGGARGWPVISLRGLDDPNHTMGHCPNTGFYRRQRILMVPVQRAFGQVRCPAGCWREIRRLARLLQPQKPQHPVQKIQFRHGLVQRAGHLGIYAYEPVAWLPAKHVVYFDPALPVDDPYAEGARLIGMKDQIIACRIDVWLRKDLAGLLEIGVDLIEQGL